MACIEEKKLIVYDTVWKSVREFGESKYDFSSASLLKTRPTKNRSQSGKKRSSDPLCKLSDEFSLSVTTEV